MDDLRRRTAIYASESRPAITVVNEQMWRITSDEGCLAGWVLWVPSRSGFHYRARRVGARGLGLRLGDYPTLDAAAEQLLGALSESALAASESAYSTPAVSRRLRVSPASG